MMGYTHAVIGAASALGLAMLLGDCSQETSCIATIAGTLGGVIIDIDVRDKFTRPRITDALRSKLATAGLLCLGLLLDFFLEINILSNIISRNYLFIGGFSVFVILLIIGFITPHRTFSHSLLFLALTSICIYCIFPQATKYYLIGGMMHIILDMLNYPIHGHGVWLLYPFKTGKGIAFKICKAGGSGNKIFFYIGLILFTVLSVIYILRMNNTETPLVPILMLIYVIVVFILVKIVSEKELQRLH